MEVSTATDVEILHPEGNTKTATGFRHEAARHPDASLVIGSGLDPPEGSTRTSTALHHEIIVAMTTTAALTIGSENPHLGNSTETVAGLRLETTTTTMTAALPTEASITPIITAALWALHPETALEIAAALHNVEHLRKQISP